MILEIDDIALLSDPIRQSQQIRKRKIKEYYDRLTRDYPEAQHVEKVYSIADKLGVTEQYVRYVLKKNFGICAATIKKKLTIKDD